MKIIPIKTVNGLTIYKRDYPKGFVGLTRYAVYKDGQWKGDFKNLTKAERFTLKKENQNVHIDG